MPCTIIIKKQDTFGPESPTLWHRGDTVTVQPVRHYDTFSPIEQERFMFVEVSDMTVQEASDYFCAETLGPDGPANPPDSPISTEGPLIFQRSRYWDLDAYIGPVFQNDNIMTQAQIAPMVER
jgi:hypothetical protein